MEKSSIEDFMEQVAYEVGGFKFGSVWDTPKGFQGAIVPILRKETKKRTYKLLEEIPEKNLNFKDSGNIREIIAQIKSNVPVFLRSGTLLKGETQERAVSTSIVATPESKEIKIPVNCVHATRGIVQGAVMKTMKLGFAPQKVMSALVSRSGQQATWRAVDQVNCRMQSAQSYSMMRETRMSDDLVGVMKAVDKFKTDINELLKKMPIIEDQVGTVVLDNKGVSGMEIFDHPMSWKKLYESILKSYEDSFSKTPEKKEYRSKDGKLAESIIIDFLEKLKKGEKKEVFRCDGASTYSIDCGDIIGEYTEINKLVIHLVGMRKPKDLNNTKAMPSSITSPRQHILDRGVTYGDSYDNPNRYRRWDNYKTTI